jgi:hypothetical protein
MGAIKTAHAAIALGPDDKIERGETELQGGCNDRRITPPIDEGGEQAAIAKVREAGVYPDHVESPELSIVHLTAAQQKLAAFSGGFVAGNRTIVRFVREDQPRLVFGKHKNFEDARVGRIATNDLVFAQGKNIPSLHDGLCTRFRRQRTRFKGCGLLADDDVINFRHRKARNLDWGILQDEFLQFELKRVEIPTALLT